MINGGRDGSDRLIHDGGDFQAGEVMPGNAEIVSCLLFAQLQSVILEIGLDFIESVAGRDTRGLCYLSVRISRRWKQGYG